MTGDSSSDLLTKYVAVLREFGLPPADIRELHADGEDAVDDDAPLSTFVARRVDDLSREALFSRLVETLTQSRRGISATASYWNYAPEVHLDEVFAPYGCSVTFRDAAHGNGGASIEIELEDAGGTTHRMRFEYPDTPLGDDNLPALLDAVEDELLASTDLTFALLTGIDRRWRVVLLEADRLAELRRRRGDRIEFAGLALLREDQPEAFADGETPAVYPRANDPRAGVAPSRSDPDPGATADATELLDGESTAVIGDEGASADPDAVLDASPDEIIADGAPRSTGASGSDVEASDQDLKRVFGDLSDVSLEPSAVEEVGWDVRPDDPPVLELGTGAADAASGDDGPSDGDASSDEAASESASDGADEEPDALDGLFDELERNAITGDGTVRTTGGGAATVIAGAADTGPTPADVSDRREPDDRDESSEPTLEELLADAADADAADDIDATEDDAADDIDATDDTDDAPGEFEWLSEQELAERE